MFINCTFPIISCIFLRYNGISKTVFCSTFLICFDIFLELSLSTNTYCTCTPDLVLSTFWSTRDFLAPLWGECQALLRAHHPLLSRVPGLIHTPSTYYTRANSQKALVRMLKTEPGVYLLLRRATVSRLPQAGCQGRGVLLCLGRGGLLDLLWSLPGIFAAAAPLHYDMDSTRQPPNNIGLFKISHLPSPSDGGLWLWVWDGEQERLKRQRGRSASKLAAVTYTVTWLMVILYFIHPKWF